MENTGCPQPARKPYITVVMAIMNVADDFKKTLDCLDQQEYQSFEVLVADCNSKDDPAKHVVNRKYPISHYVQEDDGIYDAWNKVLPFAKGEWVIFMGAGDMFIGAMSLRKAVDNLERLDSKVLIAYGKVNVIGENGLTLKTCGAPWPQILQEVISFEMFPHQAAFQRRTSFETYGLFNKEITVAGDTDMILRLAAVEKPVFFPLLISSFKYGGVSNSPKTREKAVREHIRVLTAHGYRPNNRWVFLKLLVLKYFRIMLGDNNAKRATDLYRILSGRKKRFG